MEIPVSDEIIPWFDALVGGTLVLTPNRRLSRFVQQQYAGYQRLQGRQAWSTLPCYSIDGWLQSLWEKLQQRCVVDSDRVLLNKVQENFIWESIIRQHSRGLELLNPRHTAGIALDAWHMLLQWQQDPSRLDSRHMDKSLFKHWAERYGDMCRERNLTDRSQIVATLRQAVTTSRLPLPRAITLFGFDVISPLNRSLLDCYSDQGVAVDPVNISRKSEVLRIELDDEDAEITAAARWAAGLLTRHAEPRKLQIGIVVPQLTSLRGKVERLVNNVFEPQHLCITNPRHVPGCNISAAQPLAETPLVQAALQALQLNRGNLEMELVSHILRSPFIGTSVEMHNRALLDAGLRAETLTLSSSALRAALGRTGGGQQGNAAACPDLFRRLQEFNRLQREPHSRKRLPSEWGTMFNRQLQVLGWPGHRKLDALEVQQVNQWQEVLEGLAGLDNVCGPGDVNAALIQLGQLAYHHSFHARTGQSPVQVLGLLEAAGMLFDYVWVMHLDTQNWPMPPQPNPFIPIRQQVELQMPRVSMDTELQFARAVTRRLAGSATRVIFSHSRHRNDQDLSPSPLIEEYAAVSLEQLQPITPVDYYRELYHTAELVTLTDDRVPGITASDAVRGGTQILKDQAACPFRACARHRLRAREIEAAGPGISPAEHGMLLHRVLELIWRRLGGWEALQKLEQGPLGEMIHQAITEGLLTLPAGRRPGKRLQDLEQQRLFALISSWLELEKQRQPFTVVFNESERELNLAGLPLRVRYDRVDQLADGSLFVIDYKTGQANLAAWSGDRPDEPQLPIYCTANPDRISGAAFGLLSEMETGFRGIAESDAVAPGIKQPSASGVSELPDTWPGIMQQWRAVLERLALDFINGEASVDPKSTTTSCRFCALPALCRIGAGAPTVEPDTEQESTNGG